ECTFQPGVGGQYRITGTILDDQGRSSRSEITNWVGGATTVADLSVAEQRLTLIPGQRGYSPGETAEVLVSSPIVTGTGLLTTSHHGILATTRFAVVDGSAVLEIPLTDADIPT